MFSNRKILFSFFLSIFGVFALFSMANAQSVAIPTVEYFASGQDKTFANFTVAGLTATNTEVLIYVDGTYSGTARIQGADTWEPKFLFEQGKKLAAGAHNLMAIARDRTSLVLSPPTKQYSFTVKDITPPAPPAPIGAIPAPVVLAPNAKTVTANVKPMITGVAKSGTFVRVYIDGKYNGKTGWLADKSGTANFAYKPFLNLAPGRHSVWAVAEDGKGVKSAQSVVVNFNIEKPMPAPVLIKTVAAKEHNRPLITGVAKNNSRVKVFIDKKLNGEFSVKNQPSGIANFAYQPFAALAPGQHMAYATAVDQRGKESSWSNITAFQVAMPVQPKISAAFASADGELFEEIANANSQSEEQAKDDQEKEETGQKTDEKPDQPEPAKTVETEKKPEEKSVIDNILEKIGLKDEQSATSGLVDEDQNQQSSAKLNLIIFLVFLFGVIAWIFWVNRELIKEKREQENQDEKNSDSNGNISR